MPDERLWRTPSELAKLKQAELYWGWRPGPESRAGRAHMLDGRYAKLYLIKLPLGGNLYSY